MAPLMLLVLENLTLTNALLLGGLMVVGLTKLADYRGWTRSPALVRQENADLRERNATLEAEVRRLDQADREKGQQIAALDALVQELQKRDQAAVLDAIRSHDTSMVRLGDAAASRAVDHEEHAHTRRAEQRIEHLEAMTVWNGIRDDLHILTNQPKGATP